MGLDITAYRDLRPAATGEGLHPEYKDDVDYERGYVRLHLNSAFPGRADEFTNGGVYKASDSLRFRAGSYSGYNQWRKQLAELTQAYRPVLLRHEPSHAAGAWKASEGPFYELINFSDCEGVLGTAVSTKLAQDFAAFQAKADRHDDEYFRRKYAEWRRAFEMAADNGAVYFH